ncbi:MAG: DUF1598 domain-containing protein [Pirellulaceae bacterium]|nr:DUF1598 domain-containing protein [Pirellulaceae bacterium]
MIDRRILANAKHVLSCFSKLAKTLHRLPIALIGVAIFCSSASAQFFNGNTGNRVVGGVSIDADGIVRDSVAEDQNALLATLREQLAGGQGDFAKPATMRMISLKQLQAAMTEAAQAGKPLPEEVLLLGGLTRVEYVMAYPEKQDIVIAGPSENWTIGKNGSIVGITSGRPIVYLDDLMTAFQTSDSSRTNAISCSIDPTPEGTKRLTALLDGIRLGPGVNPVSFEPEMRRAFGPQTVSLTGLPTNSHMARVIFAADYQMKRYGMNIAQAPVKGLPSYIEMIRNKSVKSPQSRWWMACDYSAIEHSEDKLAWKLTGRGIKTMTEQETIQKDGSIKQTGKTEPFAQKWAELFTEKLDDLAVKDTVFGELRNVMDVCVVAALIQSRNLDQIAQCDLSVLRGEKKTIPSSELTSPTQLDPQCTFLKTASGWVVSASGGVMVDAWSVVSKTTLKDELNSVRDQAKQDENAWTWN